FELVPGGDGGISAVTVELTNTSAANDVVLKINAALSAFITLTVTDAQGEVLSKSGRKFSSAERQAFELVRPGPGEARRGGVPLAWAAGRSGRSALTARRAHTGSAGHQCPAAVSDGQGRRPARGQRV